MYTVAFHLTLLAGNATVLARSCHCTRLIPYSTCGLQSRQHHHYPTVKMSTSSRTLHGIGKASMQKEDVYGSLPGTRTLFQVSSSEGFEMTSIDRSFKCVFVDTCIDYLAEHKLFRFQFFPSRSFHFLRIFKLGDSHKPVTNTRSET